MEYPLTKLVVSRSANVVNWCYLPVYYYMLISPITSKYSIKLYDLCVVCSMAYLYIVVLHHGCSSGLPGTHHPTNHYTATNNIYATTKCTNDINTVTNNINTATKVIDTATKVIDTATNNIYATTDDIDTATNNISTDTNIY